MSAKHTPGPWRVKVGHGCYHAVSDDGTLHTGCISFNGNGLANARLIAAAPEMYEALSGLLAGVDEYWANETDEGRKICTTARALLQRIDGGQS